MTLTIYAPSPEAAAMLARRVRPLGPDWRH